MATIYDIAQISGYAPGTVSKALNNYKGINEATRKKIIEIAKQYGYTANTIARSLRTAHSYTIGVIFSLDTQMSFKQTLLMNILDSFQKSIDEKGYDITLISKGTLQKSYVEHIRIRNCDGILIFGNYYSPEINEVLKLSLPIIGFDYTGDSISGVSSDNYEKIYELTSKIIDYGHKNIAFLHGKKNIASDQRIEGFIAACKDHKLTTFSTIESDYYNFDLNYDLTKKLLSSSNPPTCIMYPDDFSALSGSYAIRDLGLSIPEDVSISGFDGIQISTLLNPQITTIKQNTKEIGQKLAEQLVALIDGKAEKKLFKIPSELIFTESIKNISGK